MQGAVADSRPRRGSANGWLTLLAVALAVAGLGLIWISQHTHRWAPPPLPQSAAAPQGPAAAPDSWQRFVPHDLQVPALPSVVRSSAGLGRSAPVTVRIPAIGVNAHIIPLGLDYGGAAAVPPLREPMLASWFYPEAAPGQAGPTVLAGHVDSARTGPAVFYRLGDLRRGNLVYITRRDGKTAVFQIDYVGLYPEWNFPRYQVYGYSSRPVLRMITCGGQFDDKHHVYLDRTVAFGTYLGHQ